MPTSYFRGALVAALSSVFIFGTVEVAAAACPPPKPPVCTPDFTGKCASPAPDQCQVPGPRGPRGPRGAKGEKGERGQRGRQGVAGAVGAAGAAGVQGIQGIAGAAGPPGPPGVPGQVGPQGPAGPQGDPGVVGPAGLDTPADYAEFYALMPGDNAAPIGTGNPVAFPQNGPATGGVARLDSNEFILTQVGTYRVEFSVPVDEAGQLELTLNGAPLPYTVTGRATGSSLITGEALVTTNGAGSLLSVVNPVGNPTALSISPQAGGSEPVAAWLIIQRLPS
jgi:hypothetical protein